MPSAILNGVSFSSNTKDPLGELSDAVSTHAKTVSQYLRDHNLPQPSVESEGPSVIVPSSAPQNIQQARQSLISSCLELLQLTVGPSEFLPNLAIGFQYIACLRWLCQYRIFHLVPTNDAISYTDLASAAHVPEQRLKSTVRMAMTNSLFREQADGHSIKHSATSALLARDNDVYAYAEYMSARSAPMAMQMATAHQRWGADTTSTCKTAYNIAFDTDLPFFEHLAQNKGKMDEFARYMRSVRSSEAVDIKHLVNGFAWADVPSSATVVDVGGSTGTSAIALAKSFPHLNFIVQDLPANADHGRKVASETLPADIASRIAFQGHDFMQPQPVHGAEIYLLRMILHDWSDEDAAKILGNVVAAMDPSKSRLLIMDTVLPKPGSVLVSAERLVRARDLTMLQAFNSKERDLEDWLSLLSRVAEPVVRIEEPFGSAMSILEVKLC